MFKCVTDIMFEWLPLGLRFVQDFVGIRIFY